MSDTFGYSAAAGVETILQLALQDIQAEMDAKDINASGRTSRSFHVVNEGTHIMLVMGGKDTAPLTTLEVGRPGGNVPGGFRITKAGIRDVSNTFKAILVQWAKDKGIQNFGWGRATMLGRRIAEQGTLRHSNPTNVYTEAVIRAANDVRKYAVAQVTELIHQQLSSITIYSDGRK